MECPGTKLPELIRSLFKPVFIVRFSKATIGNIKYDSEGLNEAALPNVVSETLF